MMSIALLKMIVRKVNMMDYFEYNREGRLTRAYGSGKARDFQRINHDVLNIDEWIERLT